VVSSFMQIGGRKSAPSSWLRIALSARPKRVRNTDMGHPALLRSTLPPDNGYFIGVTTGSKEYHGPRGNISQGGGAFLRHAESTETIRVSQVPGYLGHRPFRDVVSQPIVRQQQVSGAINASSGFFDRPPVVKGETYITPGYSGWVPGAQHLTAQTACRLPTPIKAWLDTRETATQYDQPRSFREEVGGLMPGYKGHMPGASRKIGASNYGHIVARDAKDAAGERAQSRWAQSRHTQGGVTVQNGLFERPTSALNDIERAAAGVVQRSGGMVSPAAALAAARHAARGAIMRMQHEARVANDARLQEHRSKLQSSTVKQGLMPGYRGHVPREREEVGNSPFRGRGVDSKHFVGQVPTTANRFKNTGPPKNGADKVEARRPHSARESRRPLSARGRSQSQAAFSVKV
jgi:hypothetical protein